MRCLRWPWLYTEHNILVAMNKEQRKAYDKKRYREQKLEKKKAKVRLTKRIWYHRQQGNLDIVNQLVQQRNEIDCGRTRARKKRNRKPTMKSTPARQPPPQQQPMTPEQVIAAALPHLTPQEQVKLGMFRIMRQSHQKERDSHLDRSCQRQADEMKIVENLFSGGGGGFESPQHHKTPPAKKLCLNNKTAITPDGDKKLAAVEPSRGASISAHGIWMYLQKEKAQLLQQLRKSASSELVRQRIERLEKLDEQVPPSFPKDIMQIDVKSEIHGLLEQDRTLFVDRSQNVFFFHESEDDDSYWNSLITDILVPLGFTHRCLVTFDDEFDFQVLATGELELAMATTAVVKASTLAVVKKNFVKAGNFKVSITSFESEVPRDGTLLPCMQFDSVSDLVGEHVPSEIHVAGVLIPATQGCLAFSSSIMQPPTISLDKCQFQDIRRTFSMQAGQQRHKLKIHGDVPVPLEDWARVASSGAVAKLYFSSLCVKDAHHLHSLLGVFSRCQVSIQVENITSTEITNLQTQKCQLQNRRNGKEAQVYQDLGQEVKDMGEKMKRLEKELAKTLSDFNITLESSFDTITEEGSTNISESVPSELASMDIDIWQTVGEDRKNKTQCVTCSLWYPTNETCPSGCPETTGSAANAGPATNFSSGISPGMIIQAQTNTGTMGSAANDGPTANSSSGISSRFIFQAPDADSSSGISSPSIFKAPAANSGQSVIEEGTRVLYKNHEYKVKRCTHSGRVTIQSETKKPLSVARANLTVLSEGK